MKYYCNHLGIINTSYFVSPLSLTRSLVLTSQIYNFFFLCTRTPRSTSQRMNQNLSKFVHKFTLETMELNIAQWRGDFLLSILKE